ncbi:hypothetical protein BsWGS_16271 [Bradybaena similaris]
MYAKLLTVFIVYVCGVYAQPGQVECPQCSNPYNPASCTGRQNCHQHSCELRLHRNDRNRIEFACALGHECRNQDTQDCSHNQDPCATCCHGYEACLQLLTNLLEETHSTQPPSTTSPTTTSHVTHADSTTAEGLNYTTATNYTLAPSTGGQTTTDNVTNHDSTAPPVWYTTSDVPSTAQTSQSCVQCGDFAFDKPCTPIELLLNDASPCPEGLPYCFETVSINGGILQVVRGCAEANFCRVEWDLGHSRPGCYPLDVSATNVSCTYCCSGDSCNNITPPSEDSLIPFP